MSNLIPNLPDLLDELEEESLAHQLARQFSDAETTEVARRRVLARLEKLVEAEMETGNEDQ